MTKGAKNELKLDMSVSHIKFVRMKNGPVLTRKRVYSNGILIRFNEEIGLETLFLSQI